MSRQSFARQIGIGILLTDKRTLIVEPKQSELSKSEDAAAAEKPREVALEVALADENRRRRHLATTADGIFVALALAIEFAVEFHTLVIATDDTISLALTLAIDHQNSYRPLFFARRSPSHATTAAPLAEHIGRRRRSPLAAAALDAVDEAAFVVAAAEPCAAFGSGRCWCRCWCRCRCQRWIPKVEETLSLSLSLSRCRKAATACAASKYGGGWCRYAC